MSATVNWSKNHPTLTFVIALVSLTVLFYAPKVAAGEILMGQDMLRGIPLLKFASSSLYEGELPFWNPYLFSGSPFSLSALGLLLYPPNWLPLLSASALTIELVGALQFFLLGIFTYWLCRELALSHYASAIAALVFAFSQHTVARLWAGHLAIVEITALLPLLLLAVHRLARTGGVLNVFLGSVCVALIMFISFPQTALYVFMASGLFGIFLLWTKVPGKERLKFLASCALMYLGGLALSMIQLLPTYELLSRTVRGSGVNYAFATEGSFPPWYLMTAIAPDFLGMPPGVRLESTQSLGIFIGEGPLYVGAIAMLLAMIGLWNGRKNKVVLFFALLGGTFLLLSFGKYFPLYRYLFDFVPSYGMVRNPARHLVITVFCLSMLAGWGTDYLYSARRKPMVVLKITLASLIALESAVIGGYLLRAQIIAFFADQLHSGLLNSFLLGGSREEEELQSFLPGLYDMAIRSLWLPSLLLVGFYFWAAFLYGKERRETSSRFVLGFLVVAGLFAFHLRVSSWNMFYHEPVVSSTALFSQTFSQEKERFRILLYEGDLETPISTNVNAFGMEEKIEIVNGYDPIGLADYARYIGLVIGTDDIRTTARVFTQVARPDLLDRMNVRYVIAGAPIPDRERADLILLGQENGMWLYRNSQAQARAVLVNESDAIVVGDQAAAFEMLQAESSPANPIIEMGKQRSEGQVNIEAKELRPEIEKTVSFLDYKNNYVRMAVDVPENDYLILNDVYFPGWTVYVDGIQKEVQRANAIFRAVAVEPGSHIVEFRFFPTHLAVGGGISGATFIIFSFLSLVHIWRTRHKRVISTRELISPTPVENREYILTKPG